MFTFVKSADLNFSVFCKAIVSDERPPSYLKVLLYNIQHLSVFKLCFIK